MSSTIIRVFFFAKSKELTGLNETLMKIEQNVITGDDLLDLIINKYPK